MSQEIYSVVFDKDTTVAIFFTLSQAKDYAKWQYSDMGGRFRLRVYGGDTCFFDTNEKD
jgi:hypothetical protein